MAFPQRGVTQTFWLVLVGVVVALLVVGGLLYSWMSTPGFCNTCHIMSTRYVSWHRSVHWNKTGCLDCHAEPGTIGEIKAHINGARYLWSLVTGAAAGKVLRTEVPNVSCLVCHKVETLGAEVQGHDSDHDAYLKEGIACTTCHDNLVHGTIFGNPLYSPMKTCTDCHREPDPAIAGCTNCHTKQGVVLRTFLP